MNFTGKIKCVKCQQEFGVRLDIYEKRIEAAGGEQKLLETYQCRACRNGGDGAATKAKLQHAKETGIKEPPPKKEYPTIIYTPHERRHLSPVELAKTTKEACLYPNRYLDNDRYCNSCGLVEICECSIKRLRKK